MNHLQIEQYNVKINHYNIMYTCVKNMHKSKIITMYKSITNTGMYKSTNIDKTVIIELN